MSQLLALVIEDERAMWPIYQHTLGQIGFDVLTAADGREALALLHRHTPRLIFLDLRLPQINGWQVFNYIAKQSQFANTCVAIVSAEQHFDEPGMKHVFVRKPISLQQIRDIGERAKNGTLEPIGVGPWSISQALRNSQDASKHSA